MIVLGDDDCQGAPNISSVGCVQHHDGYCSSSRIMSRYGTSAMIRIAAALVHGRFSTADVATSLT
jgi:hypothetical protein